MTSDRLSTTFAALADPTKRTILARLARGEAAGTELAEPFAISLPTVSKHRKVLEHAHVIVRERDVHWRLCRLEAGPLKDVANWWSTIGSFLGTKLRPLGHLPTRNERKGKEA